MFHAQTLPADSALYLWYLLLLFYTICLCCCCCFCFLFLLFMFYMFIICHVHHLSCSCLLKGRVKGVSGCLHGHGYYPFFYNPSPPPSIILDLLILSFVRVIVGL
ncbi:hypothetical protein BJ508DRAFT_131348 [Ascobolus immersus RN42]|uniref:Uncharacterized protein n=1 Tax=Ascobolus immersus RN42 TaxID=1160509 RepID=A0A3N4I2F8_ASCIM|nr:hypothetical protein BJ508DRAFT_131348 [Ascobolus immersus RN42]